MSSCFSLQSGIFFPDIAIKQNLKENIQILLVDFTDQGPVVRTLLSANLGLNFNPGFFFLLSKALSQIIFSILFTVSNHQIVFKEN